MKQTLVIATLLWCFAPGFVQAQAISLPIDFSAGSITSTIVVGTNPDASNGYDQGIDLFAPPSPPANEISVWSINENENYQEDFRDTTSVEKIFHIAYQSAPGSAIQLTWDAAALAGLGVFEITDDVTGTEFGPLDMTTTNSLDISSAGGALNTGLRVRILLGSVGVSTEESSLLPNELTLEQNFPNPFASETEIAFRTSKTAQVKLAIYDVLGREVDVLIDGVRAAGQHKAIWKPAGLPNGLYFYRIVQGDQAYTKQMTVIR
ncbi:MAG: T9SS type A sorting domain-containing protein [Rhodothermales bacterium]